MKLLASILLISSALFAETLTYNINVPIFGTVGNINIDYSADNRSYDINAQVNMSGLMEKITGNKENIYHSYGRVENNLYKSDNFKLTADNGSKKMLLEYTFDYKNSQITKIGKKWIDNNIVFDRKKVLTTFTYNDLFSVYHNIVAQLKDKDEGTYSVLIAGFGSNGDNLIIKIPSQKEQAKEAKSLGVNNVWIFHVHEDKSNIKSSKEELIFAVGDDGIAKAVRVLNTSYVSHIDAYLVR